MNRKQLSNKEKIITACQLPKDVCLGASFITITGDSELEIDNFKSIIKLDISSIILQCKHYKIVINGNFLRIKQYSKESIIISGTIKEIAFK